MRDQTLEISQDRADTRRQPCAWYDGKDFVFDETYPHLANNNTDSPRVKLLCDADRPMNFVGRLIHAAYFVIVRGTVDPNLPETAGDCSARCSRRWRPT